MTNSSSARETVVVTGAGSGMGRDVAHDQAARGAHIVLVGRRAEPLEETAELIGAADRSTVVVADSSTVDGAHRLADALYGHTVTGVVLAAGGQGDFKDPPTGLPAVDAAWTAALRKNLFSAVLPAEALLPAIADGRGRIVLIGSTAGLDGQGGPYATAKAALTGYGRDLALRVGARGITVNTIAPGFVTATEFFDAGGYGDSSLMVDFAAAATVVGRVGQPRDVTAAVRWLLAVDAGWVTGQTIVVSGGTILSR